MAQQDYAKGVDLFRKANGDPFLLSLFEKYENAYTRGKLLQALSDLLEQAELSQAAAPVDSPPPTKDFFSLPDELQRLSIEKGQLYRECFAFRSQLKKLLQPELSRLITSRNTISVKDACELMKQVDNRKRPVPFSISYVTCDLERNIGGELISYESCTLSNPNLSGNRDYTPGHYDKLSTKNPRHWFNGTRNIRPLGSQDIRKLHIWLMFEFNGMAVTLSENA